MEEKPFIGKYVCYGEEDGSFTWGRIKDEGWVNTPTGEQEVFVLTDRMTCRIARSELEAKTIGAISRRISSGAAGPIALPGTIKEALPVYQRFGVGNQLPAKTEEPTKNLPVVTETPEGKGLVPKLEDEMNLPAKDTLVSKGLPILQKGGTVHLQSSGRDVTYMLRRYGYDTNVRKDAISLDTDIVDKGTIGFEDLTDDELFLLAMQAKIQDATSRLNQGMRNILALTSGGHEELVADAAANALKERRKIV